MPAAPDGAPPLPGWAVVVTRSMAEEVAETSIRQSGYRVFLPRYAKLLRGARIENGRRIRTRGAGEVVLRPLFRNYLFAEVHPGQSWDSLRRATGVDRLLRQRGLTEGPLALLADELVENIRALCAAGEWDEVTRETAIRTDIAPGDSVRIETGVYQGFIGELKRLDDHGRALVLLDFLGRGGEPADLPADSLAKVAAGG